MGMVGRFVGDVQKAALLGIVMLVLLALSGLIVCAVFDHTYVASLFEVGKAVIFGGLGYLGARLGQQDR